MRAPSVCLVVLLFGSASSVHAQWLNHPTPGTPRTKDGKPNLSAPAPRMSDGKPDFSGVWGFDGGPSLFYIAGGLKPDEIEKWARDSVAAQSDNLGRDDQFTKCLPQGPRFNHFIGFPNKIVQTPTLMMVLAEDLTYRQIFLDGRKLPEVSGPSFMGYSVGRWEGDTLVVETIGYKEATLLDFAGHPHSENLRLTERYHRLDFGHMEIQETFSDPAVYKKPLTVAVKATLVPDTELLEYVCAENEKDRRNQHLVGTTSEEMKRAKPVKVAADVLAQYVGTYDFRFPENPTIPSLWQIAIANGELLLQGAPLVPLSDTLFLWAGSDRLQFFKDAQGRVTHFTIVYVEGDLVGRRVR